MSKTRMQHYRWCSGQREPWEIIGGLVPACPQGTSQAARPPTCSEAARAGQGLELSWHIPVQPPSNYNDMSSPKGEERIFSLCYCTEILESLIGAGKASLISSPRGIRYLSLRVRLVIHHLPSRCCEWLRTPSQHICGTRYKVTLPKRILFPLLPQDGGSSSTFG